MANFPMDDSRYEEDVRKLETSDKAHAGVFNDVFQKLVNNGAFLKRDKVSGEGGDVSGTVVEAMEAASGEFLVPVEGDTSGRLWGKMKKFCEDFNNMKAGLLTVGKIVNDAKTNNPELPVSAAVAYELGKEVERVSGEVSVLNSDLDYGDQHIISDCDTFVSPVITALANGNTLHRPDTVYWYKIQNIAQNVSSITQLAFPVSTSSSVPIYYRHRQNSVWGTWSRFIIDSDFGKSLRPETLNNIVNFGDYIQPVVAEATIDRNYPTTKAGLLEVRPFGDSWIYQRYTTHDGVTYNRRRYMGTWNAWVSK